MGMNYSHDTIDKITKATSFENIKAAGKGIHEEKKWIWECIFLKWAVLRVR